MKLAFAIYTLSPWSGLAKDFARIVHAAVKSGNQVTVFVTRVIDDSAALLPKAAEVVQLTEGGFSNHARMQNFAAKSLEHIQSDSFDASISFNRLPGYMYYFCADASFVLRAKSRHSMLYRLTPRYRKSAQAERAVYGLNATSTVFFVSEVIRQQYRQEYALADERSVVLPPFIDPERSTIVADLPDTSTVREQLKLPEKSFVVLSVGSSFKTKGVDRSIRAIAALPRSLKKRIVFLVVGSGNEGPLIKLAMELGLLKHTSEDAESNIRFVGPSEDVPLYMKAADLLLHSARNEASGTVLVEAMQSKLAILCSGICGYAPLVRQANAGVVLSEPFLQEEMDQSLLKTLSGLAEIDYGQNGAKYMAGVATVSMPQMVLSKVQRMQNIEPADCYLSDDFLKEIPNVTSFDAVMNLEGQSFRRAPGRHTFKVIGRQKNFFVKKHTGVGWREIVKNVISFKAPVLGAEAEWHGAHRLRAIGIDTIEAVGFGKRGLNPASQESFIVSNELPASTSLEDLPAINDYSVFSDNRKMRERRKIILRVANIVRRMHRSGINHRDLYLCHFWLEGSPQEPEANRLFLIDLHRMQFRKKVPFRWLVKDLGGLYYSATNCGFSRADLFRFIGEYHNLPPRQALTKNYKLWRSVVRRADRMVKAGKQG